MSGTYWQPASTGIHWSPGEAKKVEAEGEYDRHLLKRKLESAIEMLGSDGKDFDRLFDALFSAMSKVLAEERRAHQIQMEYMAEHFKGEAEHFKREIASIREELQRIAPLFPRSRPTWSVDDSYTYTTSDKYYVTRTDRNTSASLHESIFDKIKET